MSIDFGTDIYEEPLVSKSFLPEDSGELSLRPHTLREYIGQQKAKENRCQGKPPGNNPFFPFCYFFFIQCEYRINK